MSFPDGVSVLALHTAIVVAVAELDPPVCDVSSGSHRFRLESVFVEEDVLLGKGDPDE